MNSRVSERASLNRGSAAAGFLPGFPLVLVIIIVSLCKGFQLFQGGSQCGSVSKLKLHLLEPRARLQLREKEEKFGIKFVLFLVLILNIFKEWFSILKNYNLGT